MHALEDISSLEAFNPESLTLFRLTLLLYLAEAQIDEEDNPLWDRLKVEVVPTMIAFKDGKQVARKDGKPGVGLSDKDIESLLGSIS